MDGAGYGRAYSRRRSSLASPETVNLDSSLIFANDSTVMDTQPDHTDSDSDVNVTNNDNILSHDTLETSMNSKHNPIRDASMSDVSAENTRRIESATPKVSLKLMRAQSLADTQNIQTRPEATRSKSMQQSHDPNIVLKPAIDTETQRTLPRGDVDHPQDVQTESPRYSLSPQTQLIGPPKEAHRALPRVSAIRKHNDKLVRAHSLADTQVIKPHTRSHRANITRESQVSEPSHGLVNLVVATRGVLEDLRRYEAFRPEKASQNLLIHDEHILFDADTQLIQVPDYPAAGSLFLNENGIAIGSYKDTQLISKQQPSATKSLPSSSLDPESSHHDALGEIPGVQTTISTCHDIPRPPLKELTTEVSGAAASKDRDLCETDTLRLHKRPASTDFENPPYRDTQLISRSSLPAIHRAADSNDIARFDQVDSMLTGLHRQVINTQDQSGAENDQDSTIRNSDNDEQTNSDDDCLIDTHEDSILAYRKRKRRRLVEGVDAISTFLQQLPSKMSKILASVEKMLPPPTLEVIASPSEIGESSPTIKKCDILGSLVSLSPTNIILTLERRNSIVDGDITTFDNLDRHESVAELTEGGHELASLTQNNHDAAVNKVKEIVTTRSPRGINDDPKSCMPFASKHRAKFVIDSQSNDSFGIPSNQILRHENSRSLPNTEITSSAGVWVSYDLKILAGKLIENRPELLRVEFSEGEYQIKSVDLSPLDIKIGDIVHIKSTTHKYIVTGLSSVDADSQPGSDIRCIRGYNCVHIVRKRHSKQEPEIIVPLSICFMELSDFIGRLALPMEVDIDTGEKSPTTLPLAPRQYNYIPFSSPVGTRSNRTSPRKLFQQSIGDKVFSNKLFFITGFDTDKKQSLRLMIESNGGLLVSESPGELLECVLNEEGTPLLDGSYMSRFLFAALLSPSHCRSAKYLQTIALGWPVLSSVYIEDCVKNPNCIDDWPLYLLPSGYSSILQCVQSCDIYRFRRNILASRAMAEQTNINERLLAKHAVLIVENNSNSDTLNTCKLIFHAFGARLLDTFQHQADVIAHLLSGNDNDRLCRFLVYDESGIFAKTLETLDTCTPHATGSAGRTRGKAAKAPINRVARDLYATAQDEIEISAINWEWLVQCVISTHIWSSSSKTINREALAAHK